MTFVSLRGEDMDDVTIKTTPARRALPLRSIAGALLFCAILGPIGMLYSTVTGGVVMMVLAVLVLRIKLPMLLVLVWLVSCIWGVAAANHYNNRLARATDD
jgi:hypothetical protein